MIPSVKEALHKKTIGIWGLGAVGTSVLRFLRDKCKQITVLASDTLTPEQKKVVASCNATFIPQKDDGTINAFLQAHDYIVPSPGIDVRSYPQFAYKWLPEVNILQDYATLQKIIGITGTIGKTTVTTQLGQLFTMHNQSAVTAGNIGLPMLDVVDEKAMHTLLELSSFQLEHNHRFAPDLGILTNLYPNHLDRHNTVDEYFIAKMQLFAYQNKCQKALLPIALLPLLTKHGYLDTMQSQLYFFTISKPEAALFDTLPHNSTLFFIDDIGIYKLDAQGTHTIVTLPKPLYGAPKENTLICCAAFHLITTTALQPEHLIPPALDHRMETVDSIRGVTFINDSKATIAQATLAATRQISGPIVLLLGGLDKGVDRSAYLAQLPDNVTHIICFGAQAEQLAQACTALDATITQTPTLEGAVITACQIARKGSTVLLSPGGSSFDLFKNYKERGKRFKQLINAFIRQND